MQNHLEKPKNVQRFQPEIAIQQLPVSWREMAEMLYCSVSAQDVDAVKQVVQTAWSTIQTTMMLNFPKQEAQLRKMLLRQHYETIVQQVMESREILSEPPTCQSEMALSELPEEQCQTSTEVFQKL